MMKVTILSVSVNPEIYDIKRLSRMSYDAAKKFFEEDLKQCFYLREFVVDQSWEHENVFHCEGVTGGDGSDTMLNWIKVAKDRTEYI